MKEVWKTVKRLDFSEEVGLAKLSNGNSLLATDFGGGTATH